MKDDDQPQYSGQEHDPERTSPDSHQNGARPKRRTIFIKIHPKPSAPRSSAVVVRYVKPRAWVCGQRSGWTNASAF